MAGAVIAKLLAGLALLSTLDGSDYGHGEQQVQRLLSDRPAMGSLLTEPLRIWTAAQFAGAATGFRIHWDDQPPPDGVDAQHGLRPEPAIRVHPRYQDGPRRGRPKTPQDLWAELIFELHNLTQAPRFEQAWNELRAGRLDRSGWLEAVSRAEHRALLLTAAFYRTRWRVWMRRDNRPYRSLRWQQINAVPVFYADWIRRYLADGYPFADYGAVVSAVRNELDTPDPRSNPFVYRILDHIRP